MSFPFYSPGYLKNPKEQIKKSIRVECFNLCTECLSGILIDEKYWLEGSEASGNFYILANDSDVIVPYNLGVFYSDCLAFEHEMPTVAYPNNNFSNEDILWPLKPNKRKDLKELFFNAITDGIQAGNDVSNGIWLDILFKYDVLENKTENFNGFEIVKVDFSNRFSQVEKAIHLYNTALKQADILSKYLCYYRVIENITGNNGKAWIENILTNQDFDYLENILIEYPSFINKRKDFFNKIIDSQKILPYIDLNKLFLKNKINLIELLKSNALFWFNELLKVMSISDIAIRLYNDNRCGIAHGGSIRQHDLGNDFIDILNDLKLLRYLSRIAIEKKM